ncbi:hypothetical protein RHMOL_Rhmol11G0192100 [Rhododendron molle]|uniref:Uncharacterized protein n=1 Tax=Rhododendron molle TaxID=49168 RepID=A0ACC0LV55_RHOML|nr:hypothetical protein RHMOL_Rhmol11G0192100 [Rhododendron molle]
MEELISQFTFLSDQSLQDKNFDPSAIEDLMKLFELEAYKSWVAMELDQQKEEQEAVDSVKEAEEWLDSAMESAMAEFRRFEEEMDREAEEELRGLVQVGDSAWKLGKLMENAATVASKRYIEAAMNSAGASMRSAWKGISSNSKKLSGTSASDRPKPELVVCSSLSCLFISHTLTLLLSHELPSPSASNKEWIGNRQLYSERNGSKPICCSGLNHQKEGKKYGLVEKGSQSKMASTRMIFTRSLLTTKRTLSSLLSRSSVVSLTAPPPSSLSSSLSILRLRPLVALATNFHCLSPSTTARGYATRRTSSSLNDPNRPPEETMLPDGCNLGPVPAKEEVQTMDSTGGEAMLGARDGDLEGVAGAFGDRVVAANVDGKTVLCGAAHPLLQIQTALAGVWADRLKRGSLTEDGHS